MHFDSCLCCKDPSNNNLSDNRSPVSLTMQVLDFIGVQNLRFKKGLLVELLTGLIA